MKLLSNWLLIAIVVLVYAGFSQMASVPAYAMDVQPTVYHPTIDTYVQGNSSTVKKNDQIIDVKLKGDNEGANTTRVALFKFDFNDFAGTTIEQAKIKLYATTADSSPTRELKLSGIPYGSWADDINTLANVPTNNATEIGRFSVSASGLPHWYEVDVTDYLKSQLAAKQVSFKLEVTAANDKSKVTFASNEAVNNKPELVLYKSESEPVNTAPLASHVAIDGQPKVGEIVTGLYTFTDADGDADGMSTYKWLMADSESGTYNTVSGATYQTLQLTSALGGKYIKFEVTPVDAKGLAGEAKQSSAVAIEAVPVHGVYHPALDTYVQGNSSSVKKNEKDLVVKLKGASESINTTRVALLKFDTSQYEGDTVGQAILRLYATADTDSLENRDLMLYGVPYDSWQGDIASLTAIPANGTEIKGFSVKKSEVPKWYEIDVTDYMKSQMGAKQVSFKLVVVTADEKSKVVFASNEAASNKPELVVDSLPPVSTNTAPVASHVGISGVAKSGETLTGTYAYADADGDADGTSTFSWLMADTEDGVYSALIGETERTLQLTSAHVGKFIKFEITPVDAKGLAGETKQSAAVVATAAVDEGNKFTVTASFNISKLEPLKTLNANVTSANIGDVEKDVLVVVALYNQHDELVNLSYSSMKLAAGQNNQIVAGFKLPGAVDGFNAKAVIWEGTVMKDTDMIPLSNVVVLSD